MHLRPERPATPRRRDRMSLVAVLIALAWPALGVAAERPAGEPLPVIPPGTIVDEPTAARFNRVILLAVSRIARGDTESVPLTIRERVPLFTLALLATVVPGREHHPHRLVEIGAGYALPIDGQLTVVSANSPPAKANLDFMGRQVLFENGRNLSALTCVVATDTLQVVDVEAIVWRDGRHADVVMRHFIWVDPTTGECSACVWLLEEDAAGGWRATADRPRWVRPGTREDRAIHVDAGKFFLGIPTREAFALVDLPPGEPIEWSDSLRAIAAAPAYAPADVTRLAAEINASLETLRRRPLVP
jgi:hypothetical protein